MRRQCVPGPFSSPQRAWGRGYFLVWDKMCVVSSILGVLCCQASVFWVEGDIVHGATDGVVVTLVCEWSS